MVSAGGWKAKFVHFIEDYGVKSISLALYIRSSAITDMSPREPKGYLLLMKSIN